LGDTDRAASLYDLLLPYADRNLSGGFNCVFFGSGAFYLGLLATTLGHWEAAAQHFEDAIAMNRRMGAWPFVARAQHAYASMLAEHGAPGDVEQARELADAALATADELGMVHLAEDARALQARLAALQTTDNVAAAARFGLTKREIEVLHLLVEGKGDREIAEALSISYRTVTNHVASILAKLDAPSRTAAATLAVRRGLG
jgi:DNA-binding NarL/FixJ family response regulator